MTTFTIGRASRKPPFIATRLPAPFWAFTGVGFLVGGFGPNFDLALLSVAVFIAGFALLWRPSEAPVLLFLFVLGWVGASIAVFHSNLEGREVADYSAFPSDMRAAIILSLLGLFFMAIGIRAGAAAPDARRALHARALATSRPMFFWFKLYLAVAGVSFGASYVTWLVPGLAQVVLGVTALKWAFYFILVYACSVQSGRSRGLVAIAFTLELLLSLGGFFSDFRSVFLVTLIAAIGGWQRFTGARLLALSFLVISALAVGIVWSAIKGEFRDFVSGGSGQQIIVVDYGSRLGKLLSLVRDLDGGKIADGADALLHRMSYVEFFGAALLYVPQFQPHSGGAILVDALVRPLMPRLLFPGKAVIDDTTRTNAFTGGAAGWSEGTSISLGYVAESYIDFGRWWMFAALSFIGLIYGYAYRWLLTRSGTPLLGMGLAVAAMLHVGALDNSFTKVFGGFVAFLIVAYLLVAFVVPKWVPVLAQTRR